MLTSESEALMCYDLPSIFQQHLNLHFDIMMRWVTALIKYSLGVSNRGRKVPADLKHCQLMIYVYKWILKYIREVIAPAASCLASNHARPCWAPRLLLTGWLAANGQGLPWGRSVGSETAKRIILVWIYGVVLISQRVKWRSVCKMSWR